MTIHSVWNDSCKLAGGNIDERCREIVEENLRLSDRCGEFLPNNNGAREGIFTQERPKDRDNFTRRNGARRVTGSVNNSFLASRRSRQSGRSNQFQVPHASPKCARSQRARGAM